MTKSCTTTIDRLVPFLKSANKINAIEFISCYGVSWSLERTLLLDTLAVVRRSRRYHGLMELDAKATGRSVPPSSHPFR